MSSQAEPKVFPIERFLVTHFQQRTFDNVLDILRRTGLRHHVSASYVEDGNVHTLQGETMGYQDNRLIVECPNRKIIWIEQRDGTLYVMVFPH